MGRSDTQNHLGKVENIRTLMEHNSGKFYVIARRESLDQLITVYWFGSDVS